MYPATIRVVDRSDWVKNLRFLKWWMQVKKKSAFTSVKERVLLQIMYLNDGCFFMDYIEIKLHSILIRFDFRKSVLVNNFHQYEGIIIYTIFG